MLSLAQCLSLAYFISRQLFFLHCSSAFLTGISAWKEQSVVDSTTLTEITKVLIAFTHCEGMGTVTVETPCFRKEKLLLALKRRICFSWPAHC